MYKTGQIALHEHRSRVLLPRPPQISLDGAQIPCRRDPRVVHDDAGVFVRISSRLGCDGVFLAAQRLSDVDVAVLDDGNGVAEYEVLGAVNVAVAVELALRIHVQGVLVALEAAAIENGEIPSGPECHGLVVLRSGRVLKGYVPSDEPVPGVGNC